MPYREHAHTNLKKANPNWHPHFFRFNWASKFCEDPEVTIQQSLSCFGRTGMRTPINYISKGRKYERQLPKKLEIEISDKSQILQFPRAQLFLVHPSHK